MQPVIIFLLLALFNLTAFAKKADVGSLAFEIPTGFKATAIHQNDRDMDVNRWEAHDGRALEVIYFAKVPQEPGEPMVTAKEEEIDVAGQTTKLIKTTCFFGSPRQVYVVYLQFGDSTYIVYSEHTSKSDFKAFLKHISVHS